jgi:single-stranded DNA-specific DHH superfamily exonuclease
LFLEEIERVARIFKSIVKQKKVKIFSHIDADGLASAAILSKMMLRLGQNFELKTFKQLTESQIKKIQGTDKILGSLQRVRRIQRKRHAKGLR